ncbi:hypothetical protein Golob_026492 [Gossypium lobatum]|uniref:Uncharacterized protein n=1 Tax=Gossypium lobatum TaxID=34289 RepID=A0A7J8LVC7_9ROSI|nr:hypothetical protein [Gossypium lobatum]
MGSCLPECAKKDLMHVVGSTFGGVIRSEVKGEYCRLKVQLDTQRPLQKGIFIFMEHQERDCTKISSEERERTERDLPYSIALKAELNLLRDDDVSRSGDSIKVAPESGQKTEGISEMETDLPSIHRDGPKRFKFEFRDLNDFVSSDSLIPILEHDNTPLQQRSKAAKRQADRKQ